MRRYWLRGSDDYVEGNAACHFGSERFLLDGSVPKPSELPCSLLSTQAASK